MSYPNIGGYNPSQMSYTASNPNYPGAQQGGYGPGAPSAGGYGQGGYPGNQPGGHPAGHPAGHHPGQAGAGGYAPMGEGQHGPGAPGVSPEVQRWFSAVDRDHSGKITAKELQAALINGQGRNFSDQACNLMIGMFDRDKSGTIDVTEFQQLYNYINQWIATFRNYDRDNSGHVEESELAQAFQQMGFRFSQEFVNFLISKSDLQNHAKIAVDQFIVLCVQIQRFTEYAKGHAEKHGLKIEENTLVKKKEDTRLSELLNIAKLKNKIYLRPKVIISDYCQAVLVVSLPKQ